ncbi:hypothetical protein PENTCL1PPCAC_11838, partial [Pristionchus entomophagus]
MRLELLLFSFLVAVIAMTPEEEACAAPLMAKLAKEPDAELKKFIMKCFKLINAGKMEEVKALGKKFDKDNHEKVLKFLDDYMVGPCAIFRAEFEN